MSTTTLDTFLQEVVERFGGKLRENQMEMTRHVLSAIDKNEPLIVESPVGSGKSLSYSIGAIMAAKSQGKRVLIVTRTKKLQDQLAKDFPRYLKAVLGDQSDSIRWSVLKGRNHYTCKKRITRENYALPYSLANWATDGGGSRDEAPYHSDNEWWAVSGGQDCLGKKCPFYVDCPGTRQRLSAEDSHIVIANQTLLAMEIGANIQAIPGEFDIVIVDEAHHFENTVREQIATDLTPADLQKATFANAADLLESMLPEYGFEFHPGISPGEELWRVYGNAIGELKRLKADLEDNENPDLEDKKMLNVLIKVVRGLQAFSEPESNILWIDTEGMHSSPIDVKEIIKQKMGSSAVIFTSATISDDIGMDKPVVRISGGYTNAGLYVANIDGGGKYSFRPDAAKETLELVQAIGGRSLLLYTSEVAMMDMWRYLSDRLDVAVYHQKMPDAVNKFRTDETSVLLGIDSCFEGIDVMGPSLSLVVIDRIPFPMMSDPIYQANVERLGWFKASLPPTSTKMRQGCGRLLRSPDDVGIIAVLDSRLLTKSYSSALVSGIHAQHIRTKKEVLDFLRQIREEIES